MGVDTCTRWALTGDGLEAGEDRFRGANGGEIAAARTSNDALWRVEAGEKRSTEDEEEDEAGMLKRGWWWWCGRDMGSTCCGRDMGSTVEDDFFPSRFFGRG